MAEVIVVLLTREHDRNSFDCGKAAQNEFLKQRARKHSTENYSRTWVAIEEGKNQILGYVALSMSSIVFEDIGEEARKRLPRYPMPVLHIGQLATDIHYQGRGIGAVLLRFAALQAIAASEVVGCYGIELIADNPSAYDYYVRRGFLPLTEGSTRLYQSTETLKKALS